MLLYKSVCSFLNCSGEKVWQEELVSNQATRSKLTRESTVTRKLYKNSSVERSATSPNSKQGWW